LSWTFVDYNSYGTKITRCVICKKNICCKPSGDCPEGHKIYYGKRKVKYQEDYLKNKDKINSLHRQKAKDRRYELLCYYSGIPPKCACCGETKVEFLAFDHPNGNGGKLRKEIENYFLWLWRTRPKDIRVLCHNCNMSMGLYHYCPHQSLPVQDRLENIILNR
jgi:hypothetical protein